MALSAGPTVRLIALEERLGTLQREVDPTLHTAHVELAGEWERSGGSLFVRVRAIVPIQADFRVIGFLPWVLVGRSWGIP